MFQPRENEYMSAMMKFLEPNLEVMVVAATLLLFVVAIVAVSLLLSRNNSDASLFLMARFVVTLAIIARDAFRWTLRVMTAQARTVVSDILTFPAHLHRRFRSMQKKKKRGGDDSDEEGGIDVCHLLLDGFHSLMSPHILENNDEDASFFDFHKEPPSQHLRVSCKSKI